jgi:hypothetical protein
MSPARTAAAALLTCVLLGLCPARAALVPGGAPSLAPHGDPPLLRQADPSHLQRGDRSPVGHGDRALAPRDDLSPRGNVDPQRFVRAPPHDHSRSPQRYPEQPAVRQGVGAVEPPRDPRGPRERREPASVDEYQARVRELETRLAMLRDGMRREAAASDAFRSELDGEKATEAELREELTAQHRRVAADDVILQSLSHQLERATEDAIDPSLSRWVERRVEEAGALMVNAQSGRDLGMVVAAVVDDARESAESLESYLESSVRRRLAVSRGHALLLSVAIMVLPALALAWAVARLSKIVTFSQYIIMVHIGNMSVALTLFAGCIATGADMAAMIRRSAGHIYLAGLLVLWAQAVAMLYMTVSLALSHPAGSRVRRSFAFHALLYVAVAAHVSWYAHRNVLRLAAQGEMGGLVNMKHYALYFISSIAMLFQVIRAASHGETANGLASEVRSIFTGCLARFAGRPECRTFGRDAPPVVLKPTVANQLVTAESDEFGMDAQDGARAADKAE